MKHILLLAAIMLISFTSAVNAQSVVYYENFDSYATATNVATLGFIMWECGATVKADIAAQSGLNYASIAGTAAKSNYMRKSVAVTAGQEYTFKVYTLAPTGTTHKIGVKSEVGTTVNVISPQNLNNNSWTEQSINFTATATENVHLFLYIWGANTLHSDDWQLVNNSITTDLATTRESSVSVQKSGINQVSVHGCEVSSCNLYDINGRLLQSVTNNHFSIDSSYKGVYVVKITDKAGLVHNRKIIL